jgi:hypothetical protein
MAEKTKKPVKLRRRAPEIVRLDRQARNKRRGQLMNAVTRHLREVHGGGFELVEDKAELEHEPVTKPIPEQVVERGTPRLYLAGLSEINLTINGQCIRDEPPSIASRWTIRGLHTGDLLGIPPTRRDVTFSGVSLCAADSEKVKLKQPFTNRMGRFIDSRWIFWVVEEWIYWDLPGLAAQLRNGEPG